MKHIGTYILPVLAAFALFAAFGPRGEAGPGTAFRDAPNGGAMDSLSRSAGTDAGDYAVSVPMASFRGKSSDCGRGGPVSKQVENFLSQNGEDFASYEPSCPSMEDCPLSAGYNLHEKVYRVRGDADAVFRAFTAQNPREAWNGSSRFEMMYDRASSRLFTKNSRDLPAITAGQIFFLTLYLPLGLKIPVVFETVKLDPPRREFAFSYVRKNKSNGIQFIRFTQNGPDVEIRHTTHFRSGSEFRDKHLYARFHEGLTDDFYENFFAFLSGLKEPCPL